MTYDQNPFVFEAADRLRDEQILAYYIDGHNYSRFLESARNVFLVGERGSGKTMALLYSSWKVQKLRAQQQESDSPLRSIGVYVPCKTPLAHKAEYELLDGWQALTVSEHFLVLLITYAVVDTLGSIPELRETPNIGDIRDEVGFILGEELPIRETIFDSIKQFVRCELVQTQRSLNSEDPEAFYSNSYTFYSSFMPLLYTICDHFLALQQSHFRLMIDDAHNLNTLQLKSLNSWIVNRDYSRFSFKVAVANVGQTTKLTKTGGSIIEGHDYITLDLESPLHNRRMRYYEFARTLVKRRLENVSIDVDPEEFFPMNVAMQDALDKPSQSALQEALAKYGDADEAATEVREHVYRHTRARYFQERASQSNPPPYSGFEMLVFLSTGIVGNLLESCFRMFARAVSEPGVSFQSTLSPRTEPITEIPAGIQTEQILKISDRKWQWAADEIARDIDGCGSEDGRRAYRLLDALARHFLERLAKHKSEPCALSFTVSAQCSDSGLSAGIQHVLQILRTAQLLYVRSGASKEAAQRGDCYVPNGILWPSRGLDPQGQHTCISLTESALWEAAQTGTVPFEQGQDERHGDLWS